MMKLIPIVGKDLTGKTVLIRKSVLKSEFQEGDRRFKVSGGFGAKPYLSGTALFGTFLVDGEETRMSRGDVEGIVVEE